MDRTVARAALMSTAVIVTMSLEFIGCSSPRKSEFVPPPQSQVAAAPQRYMLTGVIVSVNPAEKNLVVDHEAIPGFMSAMTMPYPVKDVRLLDQLSPGEHIRATVVSAGGDIWLENIVVAGPAPPAK
jgi:protein SCO1